jgi:hypothetical protein
MGSRAGIVAVGAALGCLPPAEQELASQGLSVLESLAAQDNPAEVRAAAAEAAGLLVAGVAGWDDKEPGSSSLRAPERLACRLCVLLESVEQGELRAALMKGNRARRMQARCLPRHSCCMASGQGMARTHFHGHCCAGLARRVCHSAYRQPRPGGCAWSIPRWAQHPCPSLSPTHICNAAPVDTKRLVHAWD